MYEITFAWQIQGKRLSQTLSSDSTKAPRIIKIGRDPKAFNSAPLILIFSIGSSALFVPLIVKWYYRIVKCGLVMTVREGEVYLSPMGYAFSHRIIYFFSNRKLITRASSLYRNFIIQREIRLNAVESYPLPNQQPKQTPVRLTPLAISR